MTSASATTPDSPQAPESSGAGIRCATMDVAEEMGNVADVGSWGQRHVCRGRGVVAGRCMRILSAGAKSQPDHTGDGHHHGYHHGYHFLSERHADGFQPGDLSLIHI